MSHKISVEGNFGSVDCLKDELAARNVKFDEKSEGGETYLTFPDRRYNSYGNSLKINLTNPTASSMDADIAREVGSWYQGAQTRHVRYLCAMQGITVTSQTEDRGDIVLRVAVG